MDDAPVALVTGAGRGLGAAVAAALDAAGFRLVLTDIATDIALDKPADHHPADGYPNSTKADLDAVAAGCQQAIAIRADVREQGELDAAAALALREFGRLDVAVAVAGVIAGGRPLWETDDETWRTVNAVALDGVFHLVRAALPAIRNAPAGRFVAVSSAAGTRGLYGLAAYCAAKHGVVGLVRGLAADLVGTRVTANVVCPGSMDTTMLAETARIYGLAGVESFADHALQRRLLDPAEVAAAVAWLCSPAAGAVTGTVLPVDAGFQG